MEVVSGKCSGESGKIVDVRRKQNLVFIEGVNTVPAQPLCTWLIDGLWIG